MLRLASQNDGAMTSSSEVTSSSSSSAAAGFSTTSMFINAFFSTNSTPMTRESFEFLQELDDSFGEQPSYTQQQRYQQDSIMNRFMTQHNSSVPMITGKKAVFHYLLPQWYNCIIVRFYIFYVLRSYVYVGVVVHIWENIFIKNIFFRHFIIKTISI